MPTKSTKKPTKPTTARSRTSSPRSKGAQRKRPTNSEALHRRLHRHIKLALIPHAANQYRPHAIRRYGIALILLFVLVGTAGLNLATRGSVLGAESNLTASGLLADTNLQRSDHGEAPLRLNSKLMKAAALKVQNMFADQYWAHTSPSGVTPWHWFGVVGYNYSEAGENLAKDFTTNSSTLAAWMASPEHRANILNGDYRDVGFAIAQGELDHQPTTLVVALYGTPMATATGLVTSAKPPQTDAPSTDTTLSLGQRFQLGVAQITPAAVAGVIILLVLANLALLAQAYRSKLPRDIRNSWWYKHHGIYKALGLACVAVVVVLTYGSIGQV